jgi:DNA polymerase-3 subunit delta'
MTPTWLSTEMAALSAAFAARRLSHGILVHEAPGAGGDWLARWIAQLVLCESESEPPCGVCMGCTRVATGQHPDLLWVRPVDDSRQIRIEQVRELAADLALTSHQGRYKVGVLTPADSMNRSSANALLKTLEEPPPQTLLILVATQPSRLLPTILSRCQRVRLMPPTRAEAVEWLNATAGAKADWNVVLDALGEAPMLAAESDPQVVVEVAAEVRKTLDAALAGTIDAVATAERWVRTELPVRLRCVELWLTEQIQQRAQRRETLLHVASGGGTVSGDPASHLHIHALFQLLDRVREMRSSLDAPLNRGLALEGLLRRLAPGRK